ncbi:MAG TPA: AAA family ATPase [Methanosarcina sp.]|jgi:predicted ATP-dependent endonuclease of OLD family|nr:AAA family ATPase [Methanosarcina sp.]
MIFLENIYIKNYKNLKNLTLRNFGDLNIFIGPNNSGKTSILNSINILQNIKVINDFSFSCECCRELSEEKKNAFENLEIFPVGCNISSNDQYLRENKVSIIHEYSKEILDDVFSPYLDQVSEQIKYFTSRLVSDKEDVDMDFIVKLIIDGILENLQSNFNLSEEIKKRIDRFLHSFLTYTNNKRKSSVSTNKLTQYSKAPMILFSNDFDENKKELINEIVNGINDILYSTTQNMSHYSLDSIRLENIIEHAKKEFFFNHIKNSEVDCDPLYTLILQHLKVESNSETLICTPHFSLFCISEACKSLKDRICNIEDDRLRTYRNKNLNEYIRDKNLTGEQLRKLIKILEKIVDPHINDYKMNLDLVRKDDFTTPINEQGSGVRSLICLATDILSAKKSSILLIDEPELGLNPSAKKQFLKLLMEESKTKQIFITTHDPTFVNPTIWSDYDTKISVYLYSLSSSNFKKIDLDQAKNDPSTFGGYFPHTTSLKKVHLYVEGSSDVYIFQEYLRKFLINTSTDWAERWNNIGIYHLNGDYWQHLLYTIPRSPYKCAIILDGDKKKLAKKVCEQYTKLNNNKDFEFCINGLIDFKKLFSNTWSENTFPVYCLEKKTIEEYFSELIENHETYDKRRDGPGIVRRTENIPEEFVDIFETITNELNISKVLNKPLEVGYTNLEGL